MAVYGADRFKLTENHQPGQSTEGRFQENIADMPKAKGYLETLGLGEEAATGEQHYSDQITNPAAFSKWQSELHQQQELQQQPGGKRSSPGAQGMNIGKELPILLVYRN